MVGHLTMWRRIHDMNLTVMDPSRRRVETPSAQCGTVKLPVGFTTFPGEIFPAPRSWVEKAYPNLSYFHEVDKGGHFAAWEEPQLFAEELGAAFQSLR